MEIEITLWFSRWNGGDICTPWKDQSQGTSYYFLVLDILTNNQQLANELVESCYIPIIQSGGKYDLKLSATNNSENLHFGTIVCALGARYPYKIVIKNDICMLLLKQFDTAVRIRGIAPMLHEHSLLILKKRLKWTTGFYWKCILTVHARLLNWFDTPYTRSCSESHQTRCKDIYSYGKSSQVHYSKTPRISGFFPQVLWLRSILHSLLFAM